MEETPQTRVRLVWDGRTLTPPPELGTPKDDQLQGTELDRLVELAGRVSYDSLGKPNSRSSEAYHAHIKEAGHSSVWRHAHLTYTLSVMADRAALFCAALLGRPGVYLTGYEDSGAGTATFRITANLQALREWDRYISPFSPCRELGRAIGRQLVWASKPHALYVLGDLSWEDCRNTQGILGGATLAEPRSDEEVWASLFFTRVSRCFSHDLVRHNHQAAPSQRSTRFCDESAGRWIVPPALRGVPAAELILEAVRSLAVPAYQALTKILHQARDGQTVKAVREAARCVLGQSLETELIFSASLAEWKHILRLRTSAQADAEMQEVMREAALVLGVRWPERFPI